MLPLLGGSTESPRAGSAGRVGVSIDGRGASVVMLHSSMSSKSQWRRLVNTLRGSHRLISIDLYGHGDSEWPHSGATFRLDDEVRLVESVLNREVPAGEQLHLVGHSYGGAVALRLALTNPGRVRSLALFEPGAFHLLPADDPARTELETLRCDVQASLAEHNLNRGAARFIDYWNGPATFDRMPTRRQSCLVRQLPKTALEFQAVARERPCTSAYRRLQMPTCLIAGRHSPQPARSVHAVLGQVLPRAACHEVAAGHMAPVTHPELVNPIIADFVRTFDANLLKAA